MRAYAYCYNSAVLNGYKNQTMAHLWLQISGKLLQLRVSGTSGGAAVYKLLWVNGDLILIEKDKVYYGAEFTEARGTGHLKMELK